MSEPRRELALVAAIAVLGGLAAGTEALSDPVTAPPAPEAEARHVERATFCPPPAGGQGTDAQAAVTTASGAGVPIDFEDAATSGDVSPPPPKPSEVADEAFLLHEGAGTALNAVGYGDRAIAGAIQTWPGPVEGAGAALCYESPSQTWYLPAGSSELGFDERILLYNPFSDEAVARVTFFTPTGERAKANLNDVAVPSASWTEVKVNQFISTQEVLSAAVEAVRGRLIAWRVLFAKPEDEIRGATFSLGAPAGSDRWYFPHGLLGDDAEETLTILNPTDEEVVVAITIFSADVGLGAAELTDIRLEPQTSRAISLAKAKLKPGVDVAHLSAVVTAEKGTSIIVERSLVLDEGVPLEGRSNEVGATKAGTHWLLPPLGKRVSEDSLVILNAGRGTVHADVTLYTFKGAKTPKTLTDMRIRSARRLEKSLTEFSDDGPFYALVTSDRPITVERMGYSRSGEDLVDVMGRPVAPPEGE